MSVFLSKLENVKNKATEAADKLFAFSSAFDDLYSYCVEAHEAKAKQQGKPLQKSEPFQSEKHPLLSAYHECD